MVVEGLHRLALERSEQAIASGALLPLSTEVERCQGPDDTYFELRHLIGGVPRHLHAAGPKPNPFRPWDPRLAVAPIADSHMLILNKYPVQLGHMLLITRSWQPQVGWLTADDWSAVHRVNQDTTGLWFFNSGPRAGASQPHRHLQLLPREGGAGLCPRQTWFERQLALGSSTPTQDVLEQNVAVAALTSDMTADRLQSTYLALCDRRGLGSPDLDVRPRHPYNLLFCNSWMALISRACDGVHGFSINALGFAGYLLSTAGSDQDWLKQQGPEQLLRGVVPMIP